MRWVVQWLCRLVVRTFFRRIETIGLISVPSAGPTILAINHPNGLVDPLVVMARVPRRVSFLAKEPLFHTPIVKHFVKALECLPVYRREDDADPAHNVATIEAASDLLARGGAIALFPEGLSHDEPALQPLKTGVSRIALAAQARIAGSYPEIVPVKLVPVGLYYSARGVFRSEAAIVFGRLRARRFSDWRARFLEDL